MLMQSRTLSFCSHVQIVFLNQKSDTLIPNNLISKRIFFFWQEHAAHGPLGSRYRFCLAVEFSDVQARLGFPVLQSLREKALTSSEATMQMWELVTKEEILFSLSIVENEVHPGLELSSAM